MAGESVTVSQGHFVGTLRRDAWWTEILPAALLLGVFGIYATYRAFEGAYYSWGPYLSPFYSPLIDATHHFWPWSPALLILVFPLGFRTTCYYYRKAYYRAYFMDPPACAVGERKRSYCGETKFPFILQNLHRYFLVCGHLSFWAFFGTTPSSPLGGRPLLRRRGQPHHAGERDPAFDLHLFLPFPAPPGRRKSRLFLVLKLWIDPARVVAENKHHQRASHALRMVQP